MLKEVYHIFVILCTILFLLICTKATFQVREFWAFCLLVVIGIYAVRFILKHVKKITKSYEDN